MGNNGHYGANKARTQEAKAGRLLGVGGLPGLHSEFKTGLH